MKSETILKKLIKLKEKPYDTELLDGIINELKIDVYNENMGLKSRRNDPQKKALKFLNDNLKKISDILGSTELTVRLYGKLKPALIIDERNDNQAIISPIRKCW